MKSTGAKVTLLSGTTIKGIDYVPYYGYVVDPYGPGIFTEGYGLFHVYTDAVGQDLKLTLSKNKFARPLLNVTIPYCAWKYAGNIPVPPNKPYYWLAVTWEYGNYDGLYDAYLLHPDGILIGYEGIAGTLNDYPWAKWLWDSDMEPYENLRMFSEVIRIKKMKTGTYKFFVLDVLNGSGSTSWQTSGIKAYIYRWDPSTLTQKLIKVIAPPSGCTGLFWDIADIQGNNITEVNSCTDSI